MLRRRVHAELAEYCIAEITAGDHAADGALDHLGRLTLAKIGGVALDDPTGPTGVIVVHLGFFFVAGELDLVSVDHDDEVAGVDVRREDRLVLAAKHAGNAGGETAQDLVL